MKLRFTKQFMAVIAKLEPPQKCLFCLIAVDYRRRLNKFAGTQSWRGIRLPAPQKFGCPVKVNRQIRF
jgi:hypothetical protein